MPMASEGEAKGSLTLKFSGLLHAEDILKYHPEIQAELDAIVKQGWKYLFIETRGTAVMDMALENALYHASQGAAYWTQSSPNDFLLELSFGRRPWEVNGVPEVLEFRVNVCSKSFPRAATVDLVKGVVTYLHDPFWRWEKGWEADEKKLSDAKEIYEIATWLVDVKKFKLIDAFKPERYQELKGIFEAMSR
jgi:hypothetical protein